MTNEPIVIRPAHAGDLPQLSALWYEKTVILSQQDRRWQVGDGARAHWEEQAATWLGDAKCAIRVASHAGIIVGYGIGWIQDTPPGAAAALGMITDLGIDAHGYHAGAARGLVAALREWFAAQGITQVVAGVPQRDAVAQAFWRSYGAAEWMEWLWIQS